jgi:hypothetical protein
MLVVVFHIARLGRNSCKKKTRSKCKTTIGSGEGEFAWWKLAIQKQELLLAGLEKVINILTTFNRYFNSVVGFELDPFFRGFFSSNKYFKVPALSDTLLTIDQFEGKTISALKYAIKEAVMPALQTFGFENRKLNYWRRNIRSL